jgi:hypothetical protein
LQERDELERNQLFHQQRMETLEKRLLTQKLQIQQQQSKEDSKWLRLEEEKLVPVSTGGTPITIPGGIPSSIPGHIQLQAGLVTPYLTLTILEGSLRCPVTHIWTCFPRQILELSLGDRFSN